MFKKIVILLIMVGLATTLSGAYLIYRGYCEVELLNITHSPTRTFPELHLARRVYSGDDQRNCASSVMMMMMIITCLT